MKQQSYSSRVVIGLPVAMLFCLAPMTNAQVDEARKTNWDNAKRLYPLIVDAVAANKRDEAYKLTGEFRDNLDYVQDKLERVGGRLHDRDRNWQWSSRKSTALDKVKRTKIAAGILGTKMKEGSNANSELNDFKSEWKDFADSFDDLWREYSAHARELNDVMRAFREDCRECP